MDNKIETPQMEAPQAEEPKHEKDFLLTANMAIRPELDRLEQVMVQVHQKIMSELRIDGTAMPNKEHERESMRLRTDQMNSIATTIAQIKLHSIIAAVQAEAAAMAAMRGMRGPRPRIAMNAMELNRRLREAEARDRTKEQIQQGPIQTPETQVVQQAEATPSKQESPMDQALTPLPSEIPSELMRDMIMHGMIPWKGPKDQG